MLAELRLQSLNELVKGASRDELIWISGYIAALAGQPIPEKLAKDLAPAVAESSSLSGSTIVYGTETGNSKKVAVDFSNRLKKQGIHSKIKSLEQYRLTDLSKESCLLVVVSTQGDGEPPAAAKKFYDHIQQNQISLSHLKYGVLALGDSSYPLFCKTGEDVDNRLTQLGAQRIIPIKKCDVDFESDATAWIDQLINVAITSGGNTVAPPQIAAKAVPEAKPVKQGKKIYEGIVSTSINLNDTGSNKETYHVEITTEEAISYEAGDAFGIIAKNNASAVNKILELLQLKGDEELNYKNEVFKAADLFTNKLSIQYLPTRVIQLYSKMVDKEIPSIRMDLADLLRIYPADKALDVQQLVSIIGSIIPRLYSISSSPLAHGQNELHITVSRNTFNVDGHQRHGLCSDYLSTLTEGSAVQFYIQKNNAFKLPATDKDVIMIGPGTGIAPFRSFLFERDAQAAAGRNWFFFGEQHFVSDFLYQTEMQSFFETGVLTKLNTAFSRDQEHKIYVQHRMQQHAAELFAWIENGASIFVSGTKEPMSIDVEQTLINIIATHKSIDEQKATEYLAVLKEEGRYHKDVY
ncbi:MAG: flavodoxin domain-containing protein [Panacibacter sp.]